MTATYKVDVDEELSADILQSIREAFKGKTVDIVVTESVGDDVDETEYLMRSEANRQMHLDTIQQAKEDKTVTFTIEKLKEKSGIA